MKGYISILTFSLLFAGCGQEPEVSNLSANGQTLLVSIKNKLSETLNVDLTAVNPVVRVERAEALAAKCGKEGLGGCYFDNLILVDASYENDPILSNSFCFYLAHEFVHAISNSLYNDVDPKHLRFDYEALAVKACFD
jgi:hypothetical protein